MPVRKRSVPSSPSTDNEGEEMGEALVKENPRHASPPPDTTTDRGWWKRRKREGGVSFSIGRRDALNLDPLTDEEGETVKDLLDNEGDNLQDEEDEEYVDDEESSDVFEIHSDPSNSVISIGEDTVEEYGDYSALQEGDGDDDDNGEGSEGDGDERYARLLQQQEIALARSYLQDGFLGQELVAAMAAASEDSSIDMSYEALLELEENLGEVKKRGLEEHTLSGLPRQLHGHGSGPVRREQGQEQEQGQREGERERHCAVCLLEYTPGDELVGLPCAHHFHSECAIRWLRQRATCPVCREVVPDTPLCIDLS